MFLCLIFYYTYSFFCSFLLRNAPIITLFVHLHDALYSFLHLFSSWDCAYYRFVCTPPRPLYTTLFVCPNNMSAIIYTKPGSRNDIFCNVSSTAFFPPFASFLLSPYFLPSSISFSYILIISLLFVRLKTLLNSQKQKHISPLVIFVREFFFF